MAEGVIPPFGADGESEGPEQGDRLLGGLPFEATLHPAGSGRSRWAQQELGELLGPAWGDDPLRQRDEPGGARAEQVQQDDEPALLGATVEPPPGAALWEVERLPSESEGGVVGLLLSGRREDAPDGGTQVGLPDLGARPAPTPGMARLTELLDHLPAEAVIRLTPDDVEVTAPSIAPPAVWFWGDDDIYPGKVPGVVETRPAPKRRFRHSA